MSFKVLTNFILVFLLTGYVQATSLETLRDSIGAERKGNSLLVLHRVEPGETLSALARKYNTSVKAIQDENANLSAGLKAGEVVKVPYVVVTKSTVSGRKTHTVKAGQGLYSIARTYQVSVSDLRKWNGLKSNDIQQGQELIVSAEKGARVASSTATQTAPKETVSTATSKSKTHRVTRGEGLSTIAQRYKVSVSDLREWNNLSSNKIQVGQVLVVTATEKRVAETPPPAREPEKQDIIVPATRTGVVAKADNKRKPENKSSIKDDEDADPTGVQAQVRAEVEEEQKEYNRKESRVVASEAIVTNTTGYPKVVEAGLAESITDSGDTEGYYALHRSAPVGTILQVRNEMNNLSVFVKVIGKLPDTGANDKLVVKITQKAYERLAAIDKRFRVEITYLPN